MGAGIVLMAYTDQGPKLLGLVGDAKHRSKHGKTYDLPKGTVDPGESAWDAAKRECFEETGILINEEDIMAGPINDSWLTMWLAIIPISTSVTIGINPVTKKLEHDGYEWLDHASAQMECYGYLVPFVDWAFSNV